MSDELEQPNEVFDPAWEAHKLSLKGLSWGQIAAQTGYQSSEAAEIAAKVYVQREALRLSNMERAERLAMMMARYDAQLAAWWDASVALDDKAGAQVLRILNAQSKLLGLESVAEDDSGKKRTILVMGSEKQYIEALQEVASEPESSNEDERG